MFLWSKSSRLVGFKVLHKTDVGPFSESESLSHCSMISVFSSLIQTIVVFNLKKHTSYVWPPLNIWLIHVCHVLVHSVYCIPWLAWCPTHNEVHGWLPIQKDALSKWADRSDLWSSPEGWTTEGWDLLSDYQAADWQSRQVRNLTWVRQSFSFRVSLTEPRNEVRILTFTNILMTYEDSDL